MDAYVRFKALEKLAQSASPVAATPEQRRQKALEIRQKNRQAYLNGVKDRKGILHANTSGAPSAWSGGALWDGTKTLGAQFLKNTANLTSQYAASVAGGLARYNPFSMGAGLAGGIYGGIKGIANGTGFWNGAVQGGSDAYNGFNNAVGLGAISRGAEDFKRTLNRAYMADNGMSGNADRNDWMQNIGILGKNMANASGEELGAVLSFGPLGVIGKGAKAAKGAGSFGKTMTLGGVALNTGSGLKQDMADYRNHENGYSPVDENGRKIRVSGSLPSSGGDARLVYGGQDSPLYSSPNAYSQNSLPVYNGGGPGGAFTLDYGQDYWY